MVSVIGIDPSLTATGLAYVDGHTEVLDFSKGTLKLIKGDHRLLAIANNVAAMINPQMSKGLEGIHAVIEDLPTHAHGAGKTGMVQGVIRLTLLESEIPYIAVTAATLKTFATGKGNTPKNRLGIELYKRTGIDLTDDNECDAWWLRELGLHRLGHPTVDLPKTHLRALDKLGDWL